MDDQEGNGRDISHDWPFQSMGEYQKAIEYQENRLKIEIEISDRAGEGTPCGNLGDTYQSLVDDEKSR